MYDNIKLQKLTEQWSHDRGITVNGKVITQVMKLFEEGGELASNIAKGESIEDDIGDMLVVLVNIAVLAGTDINKCWNVAYESIKDRKGFLNEEGIFIKSTDKNYAKLKGIDTEVTIDKYLFSYEPGEIYNYSVKVLLSDKTELNYILNLNNSIVEPNSTTINFNGKPLELLELYIKQFGTIVNKEVT